MGKLQIILLSVGAAAAFVAVLIFAGVLPGFGTDTKELKTATMWGTIPKQNMEGILDKLGVAPYAIEINYQQKNPATFERDLIEALAEQAGPDIIIFPSELILEYRDKLTPLPEEFITERIFRDTFSDGTEILIQESGEILGLPYLIDPLVFYYNRDLFRNESIASAPKTWDAFVSASRRLTKINNGAITQSGAPLGLESNVKNFKEIISLLVLQTGAPIVERSLKVSFSPQGSSADTVQSALRFYTDFSNIQKTSYSWSKAMPNSNEAFYRELAATYLGFGSEYPRMKIENPHLNFDITSVPQISGGKLSLTYGKFLSLGIIEQSRNKTVALEAIKLLVAGENVKEVSSNTYLAPSRRDLLGSGTGNAILDTIYREAVKFKSWPDIEYARTSGIFSQMIQSVYTGAKSEAEASRDAKSQLEALYNQ